MKLLTFDPATVHPREDKVFVKREGSYTKGETDSGLIIYEDRPELEIGTVLAVGPGLWQRVGPGFGEYARVQPDVAEGDRVIFKRYAGVDVGDDYLILLPGEILVIEA
jgi:co-chaperonin GroES (HSP10)